MSETLKDSDPNRNTTQPVKSNAALPRLQNSIGVSSKTSDMKREQPAMFKDVLSNLHTASGQCIEKDMATRGNVPH